MRGRTLYSPALILLVVFSTAAWANVEMPTLFSDHMVLQQGIEVPVWGTADDGEDVTVEFNGQLVATTAAGGEWMVTLAPMSSSNIPSDMVITGDNVITITGVQVGEVWLGSGQSNMYRPLSDDCDANAAIADSGNYNIRLFNVASDKVEDTIWQVCGPNTSPSMSAVHFYFGRHLAQNLPDVPIGLIHSAVSATSIERWSTVVGTGNHYLGQIVPLQPYAIRGATWYQGEWDSRTEEEAEPYYWQLPALIDEWRSDWGQGNFPFYVVQIPKMNLSFIHIIRDAELQTALNDPDVEMTVNIDYPGTDVHPACKDVFGCRLAYLARKSIYGHNIVEQGPIYNQGESYISGDTIVVAFDHIGSGLASDGGTLEEWEIAGSDANYYTADAVIVGDTVEVSSPLVPYPVSVRYAYRPAPVNPNLFNAEGLPASPFRDMTLPLNGNFNGDNVVNFLDYAELAEAWLTSAGEPNFIEIYDLSGNEIIDMADVDVFSEDWLREF